MQTLLWAAACVSLPVMWGVLVHRIFQKIRRHQAGSTRQHPGNWPDYQI